MRHGAAPAEEGEVLPDSADVGFADGNIMIADVSRGGALAVVDEAFWK